MRLVVLLATADSPAVIRAGSAAGEVTNSPAAAIAAAQVRLQAAGNNPAALAINQEGVIRATGVAGPGTVITAFSGDSQSTPIFTIAPNLHYHIADVRVDGASVGACICHSGSRRHQRR